jgi:glycosyltransferase involved in cell wall biosynthesis
MTASNETTASALVERDRVSVARGFDAAMQDLHELPRDLDLLCFSHLRWDFVFQRPQHLLTRFATERRVFFIEEPIYDAHGSPWVETGKRDGGLTVIVPRLPESRRGEDNRAIIAGLIDGLVEEHRLAKRILWYYTPMFLPYSRHLAADLVVYDCMDELSAFAGAPTEMVERERELMDLADVVFTGGVSLYEAKRRRHHSVHPFPSSIDFEHFHRARTLGDGAPDQRRIPRPRIGFYGVIDERMDTDLLEGIAAARPDWHYVVLGPVVKIDPARLPRRPNIHYLGQKAYDDLPSYLAGWDAAILPFARNESTRFISPTKTPEYLAAGRPVVSTPIADVVRPYGNAGLVHIAEGPGEFVEALAAAMRQGADSAWLQQVDEFLAGNSWDRTWRMMRSAMARALTK